MIILVQRDAFQAWILVFPIVFYLASLVLGSTKIGLNFYFFSYCQSNTNEKIIALTFDDGPDPDVTPALLDLLDKYQARATFFCLGKNIAANKSLTNKISEKGHLIGNHSYTHHKLFDLFSPLITSQVLG